MCRHSYYDKGYRSFGSNIPGYAQGCYFPGDEPGNYCRLTNEPCYLDYYRESPELCEVQEKAGANCPDCEAEMNCNGNGVIYCPDCGYRE